NRPFQVKYWIRSAGQKPSTLAAAAKARSSATGCANAINAAYGTIASVSATVIHRRRRSHISGAGFVGFDDQIPTSDALDPRQQRSKRPRELGANHLPLDDPNVAEPPKHPAQACLRVHLDERPRLVRRALDSTRHDLDHRPLEELLLDETQGADQMTPGVPGDLGVH